MLTPTPYVPPVATNQTTHLVPGQHQTVRPITSVWPGVFEEGLPIPFQASRGVEEYYVQRDPNLSKLR